MEEKVKRILIFLFLPFLMLDRQEEEKERKVFITVTGVIAICFVLTLFFPGILRLLCILGYVSMLVLGWMLLASRDK